MQILILGMHRSGTSAVTRLVNMMGAYFGPEGSATEITDDNPKGFWERTFVFKLNEAILRDKGSTWFELKNWVFRDIAAIPTQMSHDIRKTIMDMDAFRPWVLKDPRMCLVLPAWAKFLEVPVAVLVYRDPIEIAHSLHKRDEMPLEYALTLWEYYTVGMLNASLRMPRVFIKHSDLMQRPVKTTEALYNALVAAGVRRLDMPSSQEIRAFIDPKLHRAHPAAGITLSPEQQHLVDILCENTPQTEPVKVSERSMDIMLKGYPFTHTPE
jgi:hypothetical protein